MKRILAMLLVLLMLAATLLSCKRQGGDEGGAGAGDVAAPTGEVTTGEGGYVNDRLPADLSAYNGMTVKLLGWNGEEHQTIPKSDAADDPLKSTLYQHWRGLEDRFGITFNTVYTDSEWGNKDKFITDAKADNGKYDLIQTQSLFPIELAEEGYLCNLKNLQYPDLAKNESGELVVPWWPASVDEYSQSGALYFINSNSSAMTISQMSVIFINTPLIANKGLASPVTSVVRGSWTISEMENIVKQFTDAAAATTEASRIYGLVIDDPSRCDRFYYACGHRSIINDANGVGTLGYDSEDELLDITETLTLFKGIFQDNVAAVKIHPSDNITEMQENRTALMLAYMEFIRELQDTESWTVVPLPKKDFEQENYVTTFRDLVDMWCMPTTTQDVVLSGMILEANASSEYNTVAPFFFEQYLKDRYSNGVEGRQCFDILRETVLYDMGVVATLSDLGPSGWRECFATGGNITYKTTFAEEMQGKLTTKQTNLNKLIENFAKYKDNGKP